MKIIIFYPTANLQNSGITTTTGTQYPQRLHIFKKGMCIAYLLGVFSNENQVFFVTFSDRYRCTSIILYFSEKLPAHL